MRARYYDPSVGSFISQDPGYRWVNWYAYCDDDPVNLVDHTGRSPIGTAATIADLGILAFQAAALVLFSRAIESGCDIEDAYGNLMDFLEETNGISDLLTDVGLLDVVADALMGEYVSALEGYAELAVCAGAHLAVYIVAYRMRLDAYADMAMAGE